MIRLYDVERDARTAGERFMDAYGDEVELYRREISRAVEMAAERLQADLAAITADNPLCVSLGKQLCEYIDWLQWSFWDLPYFAVSIGVDPEKFRRRVASCGYVYLAGRVLDDALDRHFSYKSKHSTFFARLVEDTPTAQRADSLAILGGLLLLMEGFSRLAEDRDEDMVPVLRSVLDSFRRTVIGAMMEFTGREDWNAGYYERLVVLKNVDFWRCLYSAVDPARQSPLYPFLERYYGLAQKFNDVVDYAEDVKRGQPNLLSVYSGRGEGEQHLAAELLGLADLAQSMPEMEQSVALLKLGESLRRAFELGLFAPAEQIPAPPPADTDSLHWYATLDDVVGRWGADALEDAACEVCASRERKRMMEYRGFTYHTCSECSHVYVSPRVRSELLLEMASRLEHEDDANEFLEIQKIFAEPICRMIRLRAPGNRLLDLGFGRGHIMRLARAYGFEAYGMDSSRRLVQQLEPEFGKRLCHGTLGATPIPWYAFDAVVMSHVVEHLVDPARVLRDVLERLTPGGVLYVAVPDIASLQFRIFGKHWDAINPMVHMQYFNEESLTRLLEQSGYERLERFRLPALPRFVQPKWMQLFRSLGGDEAGEFAIVAHAPGGAA